MRMVISYGTTTIDEIGGEIFEHILAVAAGQATCSERLRLQEFMLTYKTFTQIGPACLPG
jgi:altronate dehydratase large subunit